MYLLPNPNKYCLKKKKEDILEVFCIIISSSLFTFITMVQTASLHRHACVRVGVWQCSPTVIKGRVACGTVYGDMQVKDLL